MFQVKKAVRQRRLLKVNFEGVSGAGKTFSALRLAFAMRRAGIGKRIVLLDSENESGSLYAGVRQDGETWDYEHCLMPVEKQNPLGYAEAYEFLVGQGFDILIGDSLTHAWYGAQEKVDLLAKSQDKFQAWAKVTPEQRRMLAVLTDPRAHFIGTMRVKASYEKVMNERKGKEEMKKVGTKTDQREGTEYEFDCVVRMDKGDAPTDVYAVVEKVRGCTAMHGRNGLNPGPEFWQPLFDWWLSAGEMMDPPVVSLHKKLAEAATPDVLLAVWKDCGSERDVRHITPAEYAGLAVVKDRRKAELGAAGPAQTRGTAPTSPPAAVTDAEQQERDDHLQRLAHACDRLGTAPAFFATTHRDKIGVGPRENVPPLERLPTATLAMLAGLAEGEAKGGR